MSAPKRRSRRTTRNPVMAAAIRRAVAHDSAAARDLAYTLAERQRDAQRAPARTSPGYEEYVKARR